MKHAIPLRLRPARPDEADELSRIAIEAKASWGYPAAWMRLWRDELLITPSLISERPTIVAEAAGRTAGFASLTLASGNANLEHMWVLPRQQSGGIGRVLFDWVLAECSRRGVHTLEVVSDPNAAGFYDRMGGRPNGFWITHSTGEARELPIFLFQFPLAPL